MIFLRFSCIFEDACSLTVLGPSWAVLGRLGTVLGRLGVVLGPSWGYLGPSWGCLGPSWDVLGRLGTVLRRLGAVLGPFGGHLGPPCGRLGVVLARLGGLSEPPGPVAQGVSDPALHPPVRASGPGRVRPCIATFIRSIPPTSFPPPGLSGRAMPDSITNPCRWGSARV